MGNAKSAPHVDEPLSYFALDFKPCIFNDEIIIVYNVDEIAPIIINAINEVLPRVVNKEERVMESIVKLSLSSIAVREFTNNFEDLTKCQHVLCSIFSNLLKHGWQLKASTNLRRVDKRCALFFYKDSSSSAPPKDRHDCVMAASLNSEDKIYLTNANADIRNVVTDNILNSWSLGLQKNAEGHSSDYKLKLKGSPWFVHSFGNELKESRLLILNMFQSLDNIGYRFYASSHPSGGAMAVDTIYFTRQICEESLGESFIFGLLKSNEIYLVSAPIAIKEIVREIIEQYWEQGIQSDRNLGQLEVYKLHGNPWISSSKCRLMARLLIVRLFEEMKKNGWRIHATLDLCGTCDDVSCFHMTQCKPESNPFMAISLHGETQLRLINAPKEVEDIFEIELHHQWPNSFTVTRGLMDCMEITLPATFSFCLAIFCIIFDRLTAKHWDLVASADLSADYTKHKNNYHANDLHTLILERKGRSHDTVERGESASKM